MGMRSYGLLAPSRHMLSCLDCDVLQAQLPVQLWGRHDPLLGLPHLQAGPWY